ncbi:hypothetical protein [Flavobacterium sp.]|uniref:hypothetical protein n=1 Tax=Flavobacterium sp. TaxID=239 RepID=UPI00260CA75B|nr:hypothetical protein [Flavobacterium sp.]
MLDKLEYYQSKSLEQLKLITPKWAYGKNRGKILDSVLKGKDKEYTIFVVKTSKLIAYSSFSDVSLDSLYTGKEKNDMRITRILSRWDNNEFVDPPTIYMGENLSTEIFYRDGQHRAKLTFYLDIEDIPIGIHNSDILKVKSILNF